MSAQRLPKCIATVSISGTLPEKLATIAEVGYDGVEIFESDLLTFGGSPAEVRRIAEGLGLTIFFYQPFRDFEAMPEPQRTRNMDRAERKFDVMQALGTDLVLVCSNVQAAAIDDDERAAADLAEMAERAARRGLRVGFEALAWGTHINRWGHAWKIVRQVDHPSLGLMVDSFHTLSLSDDYAGIAEVPGDKIFSVQLADGPKLAMDVLSWSRHYRTFPGQGALDVIGFTRALLESGYRGPLSLEVFNDELRRSSAGDRARRTPLADLRGIGGRRPGTAGAPRVRRLRIPGIRGGPPGPGGTGRFPQDARVPSYRHASFEGHSFISARRREPDSRRRAG